MNDRRALVVGIDFYAILPRLYGCVRDAESMQRVLATHGNGHTNFGVQLHLVRSAGEAISRGQLKDRLEDLFAFDGEIALLYFAGHGSIDATGGFLCTTECGRGDDGVSLTDVVALANQSRARNTVIVLDSCHSGGIGQQVNKPFAELRQGMTILTASTKEQYATEGTNGGTFTSLFVDAMNGAAANLVGDITPYSVYAHIDQSLGAWTARPVFKTNVTNFVSLRSVAPVIPLSELREMAGLFPKPDEIFGLDPTFEPELRGRPDGAPAPNPDNTAKFMILQKCSRVNLLQPVGAPHMWHAAMEYKGCALTDLGKHYWRLVNRGLI